MVQLYYHKEQNMVMQFNLIHVNLREWKKFESTKLEEEEED
jgi:hypothetical protein